MSKTIDLRSENGRTSHVMDVGIVQSELRQISGDNLPFQEAGGYPIDACNVGGDEAGERSGEETAKLSGIACVFGAAPLLKLCQDHLVLSDMAEENGKI